jgi:hypothetical protein
MRLVWEARLLLLLALAAVTTLLAVLHGRERRGG